MQCTPSSVHHTQVTASCSVLQVELPQSFDGLAGLQELARGIIQAVLRFLTLPVALRQLLADYRDADLLVRLVRLCL